MYNIIR